MRRRARWWWTRARDGGVGVGRGEVVTGDERAHGDARARATLMGEAFRPRRARLIFRSSRRFIWSCAPDDAALETFTARVGVDFRARVSAAARRTKARRRFGGCVGSAWTMEGG